MRSIVLVLMMALSTQSVSAFDWSNLLKTQKKKVVQPRTKHKHVVRKPTSSPTPSPTPSTTKGFFAVDAQWMARYRVLEAVWDYEIPEDAQIKYENGQYVVPVVVYRHYEDMSKTPKREVSR